MRTKKEYENGNYGGGGGAGGFYVRIEV